MDSQSELVQLSEDELDEVVGAGCHHHRHHHGHHGHNHGGGHHLAQSGTSFHKHSLSITGQTTTKADGSSVTSFNIQTEDISSSSFQTSEN